MTNQDYKNISLAALKGNWAPAVLASVVYFAITMAIVLPDSVSSAVHPDNPSMVTSLISLLGELFLLLPISVGLYNAFLRLVNNGDANLVSNIFSISFKNYGHKLGGMLLMEIYVVLWTFLFIIPGIVKAFSYAMTPFILEERPELSANEAIEESMRMMKGHKFDLFYLYLSFIGWCFLSILTLGIGFFWTMPYMYGACAAFYNDIKSQAA